MTHCDISLSRSYQLFQLESLYCSFQYSQIPNTLHTFQKTQDEGNYAMLAEK